MSFYFAWVANGNTTFGVGHQVFDEDVFRFKVIHQEGEFPRMECGIRNPRVGLLSDDREQWAWLSWRKPDNSVVPLFHGRLVGIPDDFNQDQINLVFTGRPADFDTQKENLAETLRTLPEFDPVWFDETTLDDPELVLEARTARWHIGRIDKLVTISDILDGEDGTVTFGEDKIIAGTLNPKIGDAPKRTIRVEAKVAWDQKASGDVELKDILASRFDNAGSSHGQISSYTGEGLEFTWPLSNTPIGGGWRFGDVRLKLLSGDGVTPTVLKIPILPAEPGEDAQPFREARFWLWVFKALALEVHYDALRTRTETLKFDLVADVQDTLAETGETVENVSFQSSNIALPIDDGDNFDAAGAFEARDSYDDRDPGFVYLSTDGDGVVDGEERPVLFTHGALFGQWTNSGVAQGKMPIRDTRKSTYFDTDRGLQSLRWLILNARAMLARGARAVEISAAIPFADAVPLSCRKNVIFEDSHLPGGIAAGKVIGYGFGMADGRLAADVTIGCSIGKGGSLPDVDDGDPDYVEEDYVEPEYQDYVGGDVTAHLGAVRFKTFHVPKTDDGINFFNVLPADVVKSLVVLNGEDDQEEALTDGEFHTPTEAVEALNAVFTKIELELKPVEGGPFEAHFPITVTKLILPKTIDMEAS